MDEQEKYIDGLRTTYRDQVAMFANAPSYDVWLEQQMCLRRNVQHELTSEINELQKRLDRIMSLSLVKQSEEATAFDALAEIGAVARRKD